MIQSQLCCWCTWWFKALLPCYMYFRVQILLVAVKSGSNKQACTVASTYAEIFFREEEVLLIHINSKTVRDMFMVLMSAS